MVDHCESDLKAPVKQDNIAAKSKFFILDKFGFRSQLYHLTSCVTLSTWLNLLLL